MTIINFAKQSPREARKNNTIWFSCCRETWTNANWWCGYDTCQKCGQDVEGSSLPPDEIEIMEAAE